MALPEGMPVHQRKAVLRGETAPFAGQVWGPGDLSPEDKAGAILANLEGNPMADMQAMLQKAQERVVKLTRELETAQARIAELEAEDKPERKRPGPKPKSDDKDDKPEGEKFASGDGVVKEGGEIGSGPGTSTLGGK